MGCHVSETAFPAHDPLSRGARGRSKRATFPNVLGAGTKLFARLPQLASKKTIAKNSDQYTGNLCAAHEDKREFFCCFAQVKHMLVRQLFGFADALVRVVVSAF